MTLRNGYPINDKADDLYSLWEAIYCKDAGGRSFLQEEYKKEASKKAHILELLSKNAALLL